ncbi:MAG: hypothetical protein ACYC0C_08165 [Devosia sp.]
MNEPAWRLFRRGLSGRFDDFSRLSRPNSQAWLADVLARLAARPLERTAPLDLEKRMGLKAPDVMIQLINGKTVKDPPYIGLDVCDQEAPEFCQNNWAFSRSASSRGTPRRASFFWL